MCGVLAENERRDGDTSPGRKGNTHLQVRLRSSPTCATSSNASPARNGSRPPAPMSKRRWPTRSACRPCSPASPPRPRRPSPPCAPRSRKATDRVRLCRTLSDVEMMEIDVFVHHAMEITRAEVDARQAQQADSFNQKVLGVVQRCTAESEQLRAQASTTSSAARGMLGKTSEVAAAAEQSAIAMREAAQTAAGLIRAIEDARSRSRSRRRRRHPRRRPGRSGREGQPGPVEPCRGDRIDPRPDPRHRRPDQSAGAQRHHRGGPGRRCRPRLRRRRPGSEEPRQPDRPRHRRHHRQDHRHPAGDPRDGRGQRLDPRTRSRRSRPRPTASARRWSCRRRR